MNIIGLEEKHADQLAKELNELLASYQIFYQNLRGYHWNIKGENFFELHLKFEEFYTDAQIKIDEIAERILTLGKTPLHTFTEYLSHSGISEQSNVKNGRDAIENILKSFGKILEMERRILDLSAEASDEGSNALMSDYISQQEKTIWMLNAYLG